MADVGKWTFIAGLVLAVLSGFFGIPFIAIILLILGLIVGFLNISKTEEQFYLIAVIALLVIGVGSMQALSVLNVTLSDWVNTIFANFIAFVGASGLVVAVKAIIKSSKAT
jgi:hypothetical protein